MAPFCCEILLKTITKKKTVAAFSDYRLLENYRKINYEQENLKNYRIIKNPLLETVRSSFSGTTPNLYCNKSIKKTGGCNKKIFVEDFSLVLGLSKLGQEVSIKDTPENRGMINKAIHLLEVN